MPDAIQSDKRDPRLCDEAVIERRNTILAAVDYEIELVEAEYARLSALAGEIEEELVERDAELDALKTVRGELDSVIPLAEDPTREAVGP